MSKQLETFVEWRRKVEDWLGVPVDRTKALIAFDEGQTPEQYVKATVELAKAILQGGGKSRLAWSTVHKEKYEQTDAVRVPGGMVLRQIMHGLTEDASTTVAMVFVPCSPIEAAQFCGEGS